MTYAEATESQRAEDFVASHVHAFGYFGDVTAMVVPDQLRSAVGRPCAYEPRDLPYSRQAYEQSFDWIARHEIFAEGRMGSGDYDTATVSFAAGAR